MIKFRSKEKNALLHDLKHHIEIQCTYCEPGEKNKKKVKKGLTESIFVRCIQCSKFKMAVMIHFYLLSEFAS